MVANGSGVPVVGRRANSEFRDTTRISVGLGREAPKFVTPNVFGTLAAVFCENVVEEKVVVDRKATTKNRLARRRTKL